MGEGSDQEDTGIDSAQVHATPALPGGATTHGQPKPAGLQLFSGDAKKPPRTGGSTRGRGGSTRGKGTGKRGGRSAAKGTGGSTHGAATGGKKRRRTVTLHDSDDEAEEAGVDDEDYNPSVRLF
jgi:hypothetical protein